MEQSPSWEADQFSQLTKNFPAFYGTRRFFTVLTSARHLSLSCPSSPHDPLQLPENPSCIEKYTGTNYTGSVIHSVYRVLRCPHHIKGRADLLYIFFNSSLKGKGVEHLNLNEAKQFIFWSCLEFILDESYSLGCHAVGFSSLCVLIRQCQNHDPGVEIDSTLLLRVD
jgi:hypothetical protein